MLRCRKLSKCKTPPLSSLPTAMPLTAGSLFEIVAASRVHDAQHQASVQQTLFYWVVRFLHESFGNFTKFCAFCRLQQAFVVLSAFA